MNRFDAACRLLAAAIVGLLALASGGWLDRSGTLSPTMIRPWGGQAYLLAPIGAAFPGPRWLGVFYDEKGDSKSPAAADIRFFEDGLPLGPAHSLHADIAAKGGGRYLHWRGYLVFSASDNSDPRSNGRRYTLIMPAVPWRIALLPALLLAGLVGWRQRHGAADGLPEIRLALSAGKRLHSLYPLMLAVILAVLVALALHAPTMTVTLTPNRIVAKQSHIYAFPIARLSSWPYSATRPPSQIVPSDVQLFEDGRPLGPLTQSGDEVRTLTRGNYVVRGSTLLFSTSDNSDPRSNGRNYRLSLKTRASGSIEWAIALGMILLTNKLAGWRRLSSRQADVLAFGIPATVALGIFAAVTLVHSMPLQFQLDSFGYLDPALRFLAGEPIKGFSSRGIGYPALLGAVLYFTTLRSLPIVQLGLTVVTLASFASVLFLFLHAVLESWSAARTPVSRPIRSYVMAAAGLGFILVVVSDDGFVVELYGIMAEAPHIAVTAVALLLFTLSWLVESFRARLFLAVAAAVVASLSVLVKPMTLFVFGLTGASLAWIAWVARRKFRIVDFSSVVCGIALIGAAYYGDQLVESRQAKYFGPQTLVCFHIPIVLQPLGEVTPARAELSRLLRAVLADGPQGYRTLGFNGDRCMYSTSVDKAIQRAADAEHAARGTWLMRLFVVGVLKDPISYFEIAGRQLIRYLISPIRLINYQTKISIDDKEWRSLQPYSSRFDLDRNDFSSRLNNWISHDLSGLTRVGKKILALASAISIVFFPLSMILAAAAAAAARPRRAGKAEAIVLCVGCFALSYVLLIAAAHTFDVGRYSVGVVPLTLLWSAVAGIYLTYIGLLGLTRLCQRIRSLGPAAAKVAKPVSSVIEGDPRAGAEI